MIMRVTDVVIKVTCFSRLSYCPCKFYAGVKIWTVVLIDDVGMVLIADRPVAKVSENSEKLGLLEMRLSMKSASSSSIC